MNLFFKKNALFLIPFFIHLTSILLGLKQIEAITKPLLLISLIVLFISNNVLSKNIYFIVLFALFFSLLGDVLLLFQAHNSIYFILGLASFLLAHIFYIIYFGYVMKANKGFSKMANVSYIVVFYSSILLFFLFPKLGDLKVPVIFYALTITIMMITAINAFSNRQTVQAKLCIIGAILFVISDSLLAINKFHTSFESASFFIMLTYGTAQLFLVNGILKNHT